MTDRKHSRGRGSPRLLGEVADDLVVDLRRHHQVEHLHTLGPRAVAELLAELGAERAIHTAIDSKLKRYAEINPDALETTGGDKFWPAPIRGIGS